MPYYSPRMRTTHTTVPAAALSPKMSDNARQARVGVLFGIAAYGFWGLVPVYFKAVQHVSAWEVLAHRIFWSVVFLAGLIAVGRGWERLRQALRDTRTVLTLAFTTVLIAANWFTFIWSVAHEYVIQASLGYFINPLVNVLLGFVFLQERLRRWQLVSVVLATVGVVYMTIASGEPPGIALILAGSFGIYGLLRKKTKIDAINGLTIETALLMPIAAAFLLYQLVAGQAAFVLEGVGVSLLLMAAGLITALPLLWFAAAARRLRLATLGFLQYLAPTGHFLLAVLAYGEPFTHVHAVTFACIWTALAIYSIDAARALRTKR